jgi:hypothetical protein
MRVYGAIAKRLCRGLQSRLDQFDSGSRLQTKSPSKLLGLVLKDVDIFA